jgi:hypothetical protein
MNSDEARRLHEKWGDKPCDHPDIIPETKSSGDSDKWWCTQCGCQQDYGEWQKARRDTR